MTDLCLYRSPGFTTPHQATRDYWGDPICFACWHWVTQGATAARFWAEFCEQGLTKLSYHRYYGTFWDAFGNDVARHHQFHATLTDLGRRSREQLLEVVSAD